jgi:hypothetical protein
VHPERDPLGKCHFVTRIPLNRSVIGEDLFRVFGAVCGLPGRLNRFLRIRECVRVGFRNRIVLARPVQHALPYGFGSNTRVYASVARRRAVRAASAWAERIGLRCTLPHVGSGAIIPIMLCITLARHSGSLNARVEIVSKPTGSDCKLGRRANGLKSAVAQHSDAVGAEDA